jgi:hypothetical protein
LFVGGEHDDLASGQHVDLRAGAGEADAGNELFHHAALGEVVEVPAGQLLEPLPQVAGRA